MSDNVILKMQMFAYKVENKRIGKINSNDIILQLKLLMFCYSVNFDSVQDTSTEK